MNIGPAATFFLWLNLLWIIFWPIPLSLLLTALFRKSLSKKILFFVIGVALGFAVNFIYEFGFLKLFVVDPANPHIENLYENAKIYSAILLVPKVLTSLMLFWVLSRMNIFKLKMES